MEFLKIIFLSVFSFSGVISKLESYSNSSVDVHWRSARADVGDYSLWEDGLIPYEFRDYSAKDQATAMKVMDQLSQKTCLSFSPKRDEDRFWLRFVKGGCCGSHGGRRLSFEGKGQDITFSSDLPQPFYKHELMHAIGFPHEQDREDRDEYIYWDKNKKDCHGGDNGFGGKAYMDPAGLSIFFDLVSLMADWTECYWPKYRSVPKDVPLGPGGSNERGFSVLDIEKINAMYQCKGCFGYRFKKIEDLQENDNPIVAGYELGASEDFYICRTYHEGHIITGKYFKNSKICNLAWEGGPETKYKDKFEILTNPFSTNGLNAKDFYLDFPQGNFRWVRNRGGSIPPNAVRGGRTKDRETVYITRCKISAGDSVTIIPGYLRESAPKNARVPFGGGAASCDKFEILICN